MSSDDRIVHAHLPDLLCPTCFRSDRSSSCIPHCLCCCVSRASRGVPRLKCVEQLTVEEGRALVPLLQAFPAYAPYALVRASIQHSTVEEAQDQLNTAWLQGEAVWATCMQPLRTVLGSLRRKLHTCHIDFVAVQRRGYLLKQWKEQR